MFFFIDLINAEETEESRIKNCAPGRMFKVYCNTCWCSGKGGSAACTLMLCPQDIWNLDGSFKTVPEDNKLPEDNELKTSKSGKFKFYFLFLNLLI